MKKIVLLSLILLLLGACAGRKAVKLFNGKDLGGWYSFIESRGRNADPDSVFRVHDGMLMITGKAKGYLCTEKSFRGFRLVAEYRFLPAGAVTGKEIPHCSILYQVCDSCSDRFWPASISCLLQEGNSGDFYLLGGVRMYTHNEWENEGGVIHIYHSGNFENSPADWNTIEIVSSDDMMRHYMNGKLVNEGEYASSRHGRIMITSDGFAVLFRKIDIYPF